LTAILELNWQSLQEYGLWLKQTTFKYGEQM
jgi:hypothetical protein